ncbi:MAG: catecholate siderophore receptor Fiu [Pseudomonadota bacterium]
MSSIKSRKRPVARNLTLVLASLPGLVLAAQESGDKVMGNVVVSEEVENAYKPAQATSPKFTQPLVDTPQTITVVTRQLMQDQGVATLSEAMRNSPGITFTLGENGNTTTGDSVFMRGFDTSGSIFLDGIRDLGTISRDVFNVEQIEIVKGPSGSDNGRGAPTGYINLASKTPTLDNLSAGSLTGGSDSRLRVTSDLNHAFDAGLPGTALRLNMMYDKGDKIGRNVAENKRWGLAPTLALGLGTSTRAYFNYLHIKQDNIPDGGISAIGYPGYSLVGAPVDIANFYGSVDDYDNVKLDMFTARLEHDLTATTTLRNTSRYGRTTEQFVLTGVNAITQTPLANPAAWTVARSRQGKDQVNEILTNQTNLGTAFSTGFIGHTVSTGVEIIYERQRNLAFSPVGTTAPANLYNPSTADTFAAVVPSGASTDGDTTTVAGYLFDTLQFTPRWSLNLGVRFERYKTEFTSVPATTAVVQTATILSKADNLVTGKAGLVFKPRENGSLYVAYASSEQPPGGSNFTLNATATNIANPNLDPQEAQNIEIGTKWELFDNLLVLTAAAFDTRNRNDQASVDPVTGEVDQYGEKQVRGIELGASGMITPNWQLSLGIATLDTQVSEANLSQPAQQGAQLNFSPKFSFTSWTSYKLPFGLTIAGGARYVASQTTAINNGSAAVTNLPQIPSYWVIDAMAGYEVSEKIGLQLNVTNLGDELYLAALNNGRSRYTLGTPRAAQLTVNFRF